VPYIARELDKRFTDLSAGDTLRGLPCDAFFDRLGNHIDEMNAMIALLHQAVDLGVTLFDTAEVYGPFTNEKLAGDGLYPYRNKVNVTTKFSWRFENGKQVPGQLGSRPKNIRRVAERSLRSLRVDAIDMFYQHRVDPACRSRMSRAQSAT